MPHKIILFGHIFHVTRNGVWCYTTVDNYVLLKKCELDSTRRRIVHSILRKEKQRIAHKIHQVVAKSIHDALHKECNHIIKNIQNIMTITKHMNIAL